MLGFGFGDFERPYSCRWAQATATASAGSGHRAKLWAEVDRDATNLAAVVPTYTPRNFDLVSKRVGNYQHHPRHGVLLDQLWIR